MVVVYTLMGASIFSYIETLPHDPSIEMAAALRSDTVESLWGLTKMFNVLNKDGWNREVNETLRMHQLGIVKLIK